MFGMCVYFLEFEFLSLAENIAFTFVIIFKCLGSLFAHFAA